VRVAQRVGRLSLLAGSLLVDGRPRPRSSGAADTGPLVAALGLLLLLFASILLVLVFGVRRWRKRSDAALLPFGFVGSGFFRGKRYRRDLGGRALQITMLPPQRYAGASLEIVLDAATRSRAFISQRSGPGWLRDLLGIQEIPLGPAWERFLVRGDVPDAVARWATTPEVSSIVPRLLENHEVAFFVIVEQGRLVIRGTGAPYALVEGARGHAWVDQLLRDLPHLASSAERAGL